MRKKSQKLISSPDQRLAAPRLTINSTLKGRTNKQQLNKLKTTSYKRKKIIMSKSVFGIATTQGQAQQIVEQLQSQGFATSEISVLMSDTGGTRDMGHVKATTPPDGATTGAATGGATGGVLGLLAGLGALAIPGLGPFIAAGPIMGALSGAAVGAATGGIAGGLIGLGIPEIEAKRYEEKLKKGNYLVAVHTDKSEDVDRAEHIFEDAGAEDVSNVSEASAPKA
jgi:uncharacterized membrane protein